MQRNPVHILVYSHNDVFLNCDFKYLFSSGDQSEMGKEKKNRKSCVDWGCFVTDKSCLFPKGSNLG